MGRMKHILTRVIGAAMCLALLTGCGGGLEDELSGITQESVQESSQGEAENQLPKAEKIKIVVRGLEFDEILKECVALFNEQSAVYVVELDSLTGLEHRFQQNTYDDLINGQGADIFTVESLPDAYSLVNTGIVADLTPYLETSGIKEEDYFPFAFDGWREGDKIYGVNAFVQPEGCWVNTTILGEEPYTLEAVLTKLQSASAKTVFRSYSTWEDDLTYFLSGSDNLWGMLDEENRTCDFQEKLFYQLIETTYAHSIGAGLSAQETFAGALLDTYWYKFQSETELKEEGKIRIGYLSDEGYHTVSSLDDMFLINAKSPNLEGVWEFVEFMLGKQAQSLMKYDRYPVNRAVFEELMAREIDEGAVMSGGEVVLKAGNNRYYEENGADAYRERFDLTEERIAEIRAVVEATEAIPLKTASIVKIIADDYRYYRWEDTTIEEFASLLETKVQLYLDTY